MGDKARDFFLKCPYGPRSTQQPFAEFGEGRLTKSDDTAIQGRCHEARTTSLQQNKLYLVAFSEEFRKLLLNLDTKSLRNPKIHRRGEVITMNGSRRVAVTYNLGLEIMSGINKLMKNLQKAVAI